MNSFTKLLFLILLSESAHFRVAAQRWEADFGKVISDDASSFIIGGTNAKEGQFPYFVQMETNYTKDSKVASSVCGGSLIAPDVVLSAAHCDQMDTIGRRALVGAVEKSKEESGAAWYDCIDWKTHTDWNASAGVSGGFDFALCRLDRRVETIDPLVLLELNEDASIPETGKAVTAIGMGRIQFEPKVKPDTLQFTTIPVISQERCEDLWGKPRGDSMICYKDFTLPNPNATCKGDSGGPSVLVTERDGRPVHIQVGVTSFGNKCGHLPSVAARVSAGMPWIRDTVCNVFMSDARFCATPSPSDQPSILPSILPTNRPSDSNYPSNRPSDQSSKTPISQPSVQPSGNPVSYRSDQPSGKPSSQQSGQPSNQPTNTPSQPSSKTSKAPKMSKKGLKKAKKAKKSKYSK